MPGLDIICTPEYPEVQSLNSKLPDFLLRLPDYSHFHCALTFVNKKHIAHKFIELSVRYVNHLR